MLVEVSSTGRLNQQRNDTWTSFAEPRRARVQTAQQDGRIGDKSDNTAIAWRPIIDSTTPGSFPVDDGRGVPDESQVCIWQLR